MTSGVDTFGRPLRSHVRRIIEPAEGAVVVRIFELYASGLGLKAIAKRLTNERVEPPTPFVRRDPTKVQPLGRWAPATIGAILGRELYRGILVWNRSQKRDDWGKQKQRPRPASDWKRVPVPELRIVSDRLWASVQSRRADIAGKAVRFESGRISGRPPKHATQNLLAGLATCGHRGPDGKICGGGLIVETSARKRGRIPEYVCFRHRTNGTCDNALRMPAEEMKRSSITGHRGARAHAGSD